MNFATILASFIAMSNPTPATCATLDNVMNEASWPNKYGKIQVAYYEGDESNGVGLLKFNRPVPIQVRQAEQALHYGQSGSKTITVCS